MNQDLKSISPYDLVPMNVFTGTFPVSIDLVYAQADHPDNHFEQLYSKQARLIWVHKDLAAITLLASRYAHEERDWVFKLNDGLRTVNAQLKMTRFGIHPDFISKPGGGAHPRGMAIDIEPMDSDGQRVDMGTPYDFFVDDPDEDDNLAARSYENFESNKDKIIEYRRGLEYYMVTAARDLDLQITPLPQEWWDFRLPREIWEDYKALNEEDLMPCQRLLDVDEKEVDKILDGNIPEPIQQSIDEVLSALNKK